MQWMLKIMLFMLILLGIGCESKLSDATAEPGTTQLSSATPVPAEFQKGEAAFNINCARCHGDSGRGTDQGPTFLNRVYHPNHHGDQAFYRAAMQGVRAHHWKFGDMPPVEGMTKDLMVEVISYIRWLQREAGIY
jgi:cytochrome c